MNMSAAAMPASVAWRTLGAPARGAARLAPAPHIPGYRLLREIGTGRRSGAWLAVDLARYTEVVLKLQPAPGPALQREWEIASRLQGEHLVKVHAQGSTGAWRWLSMDHLPGGDLALRMRGGLAREQALSFAAQAARGLAELHRAGFVHRDVKPANFLLRADGSLVLADFGLSVPSGHVDRAKPQDALTGTPRYVAPEQLQGAPAAAAADVYGLGVMLYEMLCGRPPFAGATLMEVLAQHLVAPAPRLPSALADLQPLVDRMLAKEAPARLPDADAVLGLLARGGERDPE